MMLNFFKKEKSASLQNQPNRTGFNGQPTDDQSLEFLMYGASAYKNQDFVKSQVILNRWAFQNKLSAEYLGIYLGTGQIDNRLGRNQKPTEKRTKRTNKEIISETIVG